MIKIEIVYQFVVVDSQQLLRLFRDGVDVVARFIYNIYIQIKMEII